MRDLARIIAATGIGLAMTFAHLEANASCSTYTGWTHWTNVPSGGLAQPASGAIVLGHNLVTWAPHYVAQGEGFHTWYFYALTNTNSNGDHKVAYYNGSTWSTSSPGGYMRGVY